MTQGDQSHPTVERRPAIGVGVAVLRPGPKVSPRVSPRVSPGEGSGEGSGVSPGAAVEILLIRRGKPPMEGEWSIPGGRQEWGETVRAAACREVLEETGLQIEILGLIDVVDALVPDKNRGEGGGLTHHYTLVDFAARVLEGTARPGSDATAVQWVSLDEIDAYLPWSETRRIAREACDFFVKGAAITP